MDKSFNSSSVSIIGDSGLTVILPQISFFYFQDSEEFPLLFSLILFSLFFLRALLL